MITVHGTIGYSKATKFCVRTKVRSEGYKRTDPLALIRYAYLTFYTAAQIIPLSTRHDYHCCFKALTTSKIYSVSIKSLSDPTSDLVRQYDFPVLLRCRKTSDTIFVAFVRPLSEPVRRFSSCSTDFRQQIAQVVLFLFLHVFLF
jgi:hypothetical protein